MSHFYTNTTPDPLPRMVRILLSGSDALRWVALHRANARWLAIAEDIESAREPARPAVLEAIRGFRNTQPPTP